MKLTVEGGNMPTGQGDLDKSRAVLKLREAAVRMRTEGRFDQTGQARQLKERAWLMEQAARLLEKTG